MKKFFTFLITIFAFSTSALFAQDFSILLNPGGFTDCHDMLKDPPAFYEYEYSSGEGKSREFMISNNIHGNRMFAQIFRVSKEYTISVLDIYFKKVKTGTEGTMTAKIYELGEDNLPSGLLAESPVSTDGIRNDGDPGNELFFFNEPVVVPKDFIVVIELPEYSDNLQLAVAASKPGCFGTENSVLVYTQVDIDGNKEWRTITARYPDVPLFDLAIFAHVEEEIGGGDTFLRSNNKPTFTVSPNPATDVVYIENAVESNFRMIDMTGKTVIERNIQNVNEAVEISHLEKGIYFIEVTGKSNERNTQKLIKR